MREVRLLRKTIKCGNISIKLAWKWGGPVAYYDENYFLDVIDSDEAAITDTKEIIALYKYLLETLGREQVMEYLTNLSGAQNHLAETSIKIMLKNLDTSEEKRGEMLSQEVMSFYNNIEKIPRGIKVLFASLGRMTDEEREQLTAANKQISNNSGPIEMEFISNFKSLSINIANRRPKNYIMAMDNLSQNLPRLTEYNEIRMGKKGGQQITTAVTIDVPENMKIEGNINFSSYEKSIINAVSSIIEAGNTTFTLATLYHAMTGKENPSLDDQLMNELRQRLDKMRKMMITIDFTKEIQAKFMPEMEEFTIEGYLLPLTKAKGKVNGKYTEVYKIIDTPPLYRYAKAKKQLSTVPLILLNAPVNNNSSTIPLKTYVLWRIEGMKNKNNKLISNKILFDSIYSELGEIDANKVRKKRIRDYTKTILEHFVNEKYITSYEETKNGRVIDGIKIYFKE